MAWTTPRTWVTGETPTAAIFNAHVRDNLNFLYGAPACRVYNNAAQAIVTATSTDLSYNTERFDNDTMHAAGSPTAINFTTAGRYLIATNVEFAANATGYRAIGIFHNGPSTTIVNEQLPVVSAAATTILGCATIYAATAAQAAVTQVYQTSGGNLNVNSTANYSPEFMAHWMGN